MKKIVGFFILAIAGMFAFAEEEKAAQETVTLTLDKAVEYALENSNSLKSNDIDLAIKERAAKYAWNVFLPTVQISGTMNRANESNFDTIASSAYSAATVSALRSKALYGSSTDSYGMYMNNQADTILKMDQNQLVKNAGFSDNESAHWTTIGNISASLNLSLAYIQQIKAAKAGYEGGKISWEQSQTETVINIKKLFHAILLQQESLKINRATLDNKKQRMNQAQANYKNGTLPELRLLQTQVDYENSKPNVEDAERAINQQLDTFAFLIGMPVGTKIVLEGSIEPVYIEANTEDLLSKYSENSLTIKALQNNIDILKMNLAAIDLSTWTPALAISWNYQPALIYGLDFDRYSNSNNWTDKGGLNLTLTWNLTNMLPFSSNRQNAKDLKANIEKLQLKMDTLKENQKIEVRKAVDTLNQTKVQIEAMERNVNLAQRAYDMTYRSYRNGLTEFLDLKDAENSLNSSKLGQLQQKMNYINALMDLEKTLNTTLTK